MARKTARSQKFARIINAFSAGIAVWALANIAVIIVSLVNKASPPVGSLESATDKKVSCIDTITVRILRNICHTHTMHHNHAAGRLHVDSMEHISMSVCQDPLVGFARAICSVRALSEDTIPLSPGTTAKKIIS